MYGSGFCRVYNEFGWNVYPEVFGERLLRWLDRNGIPVRTALDLGCGTGVLCRVLSAAGISASGVDLSEAMVAVARENAPGLRFDVGDMVTWRPERPVDLVTCTGDALNHLFGLGDVARVFENAAGYLTPGGVFVFDLLSEGEIPDDEPFVLRYSDTVSARFRTSREDGAVHLHIDVFEQDVLKFEEDILEKVHEIGAVTALLEKAGLTLMQCGHRLLPDEGADAATWFVAARKGTETGK